MTEAICMKARALIEADPRLAREVARQLVCGKAGGMTTRQRALLVFVRGYIDRHGVAPSFEEMKSGLGLASKAGIHRMISGLEDRGFLTHAPRRARSIRLVSL
ncbi:LexA family protein [Mesorhizobium sp. NPDC059054]|uniref:LexA family protein n=1 Tax=Mesorhizobium sp. NPDC059054 TaxID=3346711 RepID=UPI0036A9B516